MALPNRVSKGVVSRLIRRVVIGVGGSTGGGSSTPIVGIVALEIYLDTLPETWERMELFLDDAANGITDFGQSLDDGDITEEALVIWFNAN